MEKRIFGKTENNQDIFLYTLQNEQIKIDLS